MHYKKIALLIAIVLGVAHSDSSFAGPAEGYSEEGLPEYCPYVQLGSLRKSAETERYGSIYGKDAFHAMHHYCWGLDYFRLALQTRDNEMYRKGTFRDAVSNFDYVLERTATTFILRPEILVKKASALIFMDKPREGLVCLQDALELRPDFLPAYVALSNYFYRAGEIEEARRILETGLGRVPNSEMLKRKLAQLSDSAAVNGP